jgi:hypothetical protein
MCTLSHPGWITRPLLAAALGVVALQAAPVNAAATGPDSVWAALLKDTLRSVTGIVGPAAKPGTRVAPVMTLMGVRG